MLAPHRMGSRIRGVPRLPACIALVLGLAWLLTNGLPAAAMPDPVSIPGPGPWVPGRALVGSPPDVVLLVIDDLPQIDERVWRRLPTIGRLFLRQGTRFTSSTGNDPLCCPGRATLLTGQRTSHHGVLHNDARGLDPRTTIATELGARGYHTIYAGKHLDNTEALGDKTPPGWDHALVYSGGYGRVPLWRDGVAIRSRTAHGDYTTDLIARTAIGRSTRWPRVVRHNGAMRTLSSLFDQNRAWAAQLVAGDPDYFRRLVAIQAPEYLWIGCSDSRVPANTIVGLAPGELFVHRNVANVVVQSDVNCLSVLQYAIDVLRVEHVIVCGHYGCGGIASALDGTAHGLIDNWLGHVRDIADVHDAELSRLTTVRERQDRLCELNVRAQARNVERTTVVHDARARGQIVEVHAWIYSLQDGLLRDLAG